MNVQPQCLDNTQNLIINIWGPARKAQQRNPFMQTKVKLIQVFKYLLHLHRESTQHYSYVISRSNNRTNFSPIKNL